LKSWSKNANHFEKSIFVAALHPCLSHALLTAIVRCYKHQKQQN